MAPSWPPRLASRTREDPASASASASASQQRPLGGTHALPRRPKDPRDPSRISGIEAALDNSQVQVDSSSSDSEYKRPRPSRPKHGRSLSHPFPSLFSGKKKKQSNAGRGFGDSDSSSDEAAQPPPRRGTSQRNMPRISGGQGARDFVTGNCMTCGSLVRWPKDLKVFKCTICLTVNDLEPHDLKPRLAGITQRSVDENTESGPVRRDSTSDEEFLSLQHTKTLIKDCLESFLSNVIQDRALIHTQETDMPLSCSSGWRPSDGPQRVAPREDHSFSPTAHGRSSRPPCLDQSSGTAQQPSHIPRSFSSSFPDRPPNARGFVSQTRNAEDRTQGGAVLYDAKRIFKPLEDYFVARFASTQCLARSFATRPNEAVHVHQASTEAVDRRHHVFDKESPDTEQLVPELDAKLLLVGDFAENGLWWTGGQNSLRGRRPSAYAAEEAIAPTSRTDRICPIQWEDLDQWYKIVTNAAETWKHLYDDMKPHAYQEMAFTELLQVESMVLVGQEHTQRTLLKATEVLLKRPGRPVIDCCDLRYLLILLANPLLCAGYRTYAGTILNADHRHGPSQADLSGSRGIGPTSGQHSGIIKRLLGLLSNASNELQTQLIKFVALYPQPRFGRLKDLVSGFLAYRLIRQNQKKQEAEIDVTDGLIPNISGSDSVATLHAALGQQARSSKKAKEPVRKIIYADDWQIKAATRVMALLFAANNHHRARRRAQTSLLAQPDAAVIRGDIIQARSQVLPTSDFYTTLLDSSDLIADFEAWEQKRDKFSFCQYPFLLSIWAKIQILEYDAKRQMKNKARDAFFDSIMTRRNIEQYLVLNVRRECLVEDSLKGVSEIVGSGGEDIKKGLRIIFRGEEGIDGGGLRKEWFLLLVREVFNPEHGMFIYDEDSQYCYFNPNSFETSDQFFLVGVVIGLAIYNSTILDVALPPFAFRKLLLAAPAPASSMHPNTRPVMTYTLDDLAEYRPRLAHGLRKLLEYDGDVETAFCLDFVIDVEKYGSIEQVHLCPGADRRSVTNSNRREYVDLYVRCLLEIAVARQFEPFKRGFYKVCGGNALSLFRPEEIELLVRGSDEPLDITSLRAVAQYDGWKSRKPEQQEMTIQWFWQSFQSATSKDQRKLLTFITGSDRIPATGASALSIRVVCLGEDVGRYPTARTCFNTLALWRYDTRQRLERMLWGAVHESEGFGLK